MALLIFIFSQAGCFNCLSCESAITPPTLLQVAIRMPLLRKGITQREADNLLGLKDCLLGSAGGTTRSLWVTYPVKPGFRLDLYYEFDLASSQMVLTKWTLCSD